ncbi:hypothetical protein BD413DRAFT_552637 [Trametes elegans]|nr:hypothetical protein BD413DRAFT_552637 [Trametes elegans]
MFQKTLALVIAATLAASTMAQGVFVIDTPAVARQCIPTAITWRGGVGEDAHFQKLRDSLTLPITSYGETLQSFPNIREGVNTFLWQTNVRAGTEIGLKLVDADGVIAQSSPFTVQDGPDWCDPL